MLGWGTVRAMQNRTCLPQAYVDVGDIFFLVFQISTANSHLYVLSKLPKSFFKGVYLLLWSLKSPIKVYGFGWESQPPIYYEVCRLEAAGQEDFLPCCCWPESPPDRQPPGKGLASGTNSTDKQAGNLLHCPCCHTGSCSELDVQLPRL